MPMVSDGTDTALVMPKYANLVSTGMWSCIPFGNEGTCVLGADVTTADDTAISANPDVQSIPANLSANLSAGAVTQVQAALESRNIPAGWVTTSLTWRQVLRTVFTMALFMQRFTVYSVAKFFQSGVTLSTTFGSLPAGIRSALNNAAQSFGFNTTGITGSTTIRAALKILGDQWPSINPIHISGEVF